MDDDWTPQIGDAVVVTEGPFEEFEGIIENIDEETGKLNVCVSFFGRDTPVWLDKQQIRKLV